MKLIAFDYIAGKQTKIVHFSLKSEMIKQTNVQLFS